ncbi:MAG: STAS domain-containing protein [Pseudomonadota bacterium]
MSQDMSITKKIVDDCVIISLQGRIEEKNIPSIKEHLQITWKEDTCGDEECERKDLDNPQTKHSYSTIIDLSEVTYLDSVMLSVLVEALYQHEEHGGHLCIGGVNNEVRMILELLQLHKVILVFPDQRTALAHSKKEIIALSHIETARQKNNV